MSNYSHGRLRIDKENTSWTKIFGYVPRGSTVLDIGCSTGELGEALKNEKDCKVYGIELDKEDLLEARKALTRVYNFNIENENIPTELAEIKFDVIIMADVIEHLAKPIESLYKIRQLLKRNGRLVFSIPNMSHISVRLQLLGGHFTYNETGLLDKTHLHFYDFDEVKRVIGGAGYQIVENDANILNYTPSFLKKKLVDLGLKDNGFVNRAMADIAAQSFQFVGYAQLLEGKDKPSNVTLSSKTPEKELVEYIENLAADNKVLSLAIKKNNKDLESLRAELERINSEYLFLHKHPLKILLRKFVKNQEPR